jgi:pimeloyl-ACP methyl ester carboxylesterase
MNIKILWTKSRARLKLIQDDHSKKFNWLFLPGGPGLGSESLYDLISILNLPDAIWLVDFPGDGSNTTEDDERYFANWSDALIEAVDEFDNVILVAHSSGGMFALATPELESKLKGLVLMDSAPDAGWQQYFAAYVSQYPIAEAEILQKKYEINPSNEILKNLTIACAPYFSTTKSREKIITLLNSLPFNYKTHLWADKNFDKTYKAKWAPQKIPTLIFSGDQDVITPLKLFHEAKEFQRPNITIREISNASHFPWLDNPEQVRQTFEEWIKKLAINK